MNIQDAAKILGLVGDIDPKTVKKAYKRAAQKYHPDRNPGGLEMMKAVNQAYEVLKAYTGKIEESEKDTGTYPDDLLAAIELALSLGLEVEICGAWLWVSGDTKPVKDQLKGAGFYWAGKKAKWYYRPADYKSRGRGKFSMDQIRDMHGSTRVERESRKTIKAA